MSVDSLKSKPRKRSTSPTGEDTGFDSSKNVMMTSSYERDEQKYVAEEKAMTKGKH